MWPFSNKTRPGASDRALGDGVVARYNAKMNFWWFKYQGVEFYTNGPIFEGITLEHAQQALALLRTLDRELRECVAEMLAESSYDQSKARVATVGLTAFRTAATLEVGFVGDATWGDFGVDVEITNGKIVDVYGGD